MDRRLLVLALLTVGCRDAVSPHLHDAHAPAFAAAAGSGITLDQQNGLFGVTEPWGAGGTHLGKGFTPQNPHVGDAIVATFSWVGSTNTIVEVTDHLSDAAQTHVGNTYTLVEYVTHGGISMATYIATNVHGFPDASTASDSILAVHAIFSDRVTEGGMLISAWSGVSGATAQALAAHRSASGTGPTPPTPTTADPGAIPVNPGALAFGVTMSDRVVGLGTPSGFTTVNEGDDSALKADAEYFVQGAAPGSAQPLWTWFFDQAPSSGTWLATVFALNPAAVHLSFTTQPTATMPLMTIPTVRVSVVDDQGVTLTSFSGSITIAIGRNGGMLMPGTLAGTKTMAVVNGVATFSDLSIDQPGSGYTLVATGAGVTGAESAAFNIGPL